MTVHEQVLASMKQMQEKFAQQGMELLLPPPSSSSLATRFIDIDPGKMLAAEFPFDMKFANPLGLFQGGFLCAAFDEVYGPLTYMAAGRPVVTIEMSTSFVRPFTKHDGVISIRAEIVAKTSSLLMLRAEAKNQEGKLIATSTSHSMIVNDRKS